MGLKSGLLNLGLEVRILLIRYENSSAQKTPASDQVDYDIWGGYRFLSTTIDGQILEAAHSILIQTLLTYTEILGQDHLFLGECRAERKTAVQRRAKVRSCSNGDSGGLIPF